MPIISKIYHSSGQLGPNVLAKEGPKVEVEISLASALQQTLQANKTAIPSPIKGLALIDTGAQISCIDDTVASRLGINPTAQTHAGGMAGHSIRNLYPAKITIVAGSQRWQFESTRLMGVDIIKQDLIALIGRDFLRQGMMVYTGFLGIVDLSI